MGIGEPSLIPSSSMEFLENVTLATYTTFRIGGPARWFAEAVSEPDILTAVEFARERGIPLFVLGGGSNLLVSDAGFDGLVLRIGLRGMSQRFEGDCLHFEVAAGESWDEFVSLAVGEDCGGIECLAGIPGTVGGTPIQNVGAYGQEVAESIVGVRCLDLHSREFAWIPASACGFAYRQSLFNTTERGRYVVTKVEYSLSPGGEPTLSYTDLKKHFGGWDRVPSLVEVADAVRRIRRAKGMFLVEGDPDCRSAGSFFKNPVVDVKVLAAIEASMPAGVTVPRYPAGEGRVKLAAAWLLDQTGFTKGYGEGRAGISSRHTLALVNRGGATAAEILELSARIVSAVEARFGVRLEREPVWLS
jgi:UDP-N-acetylmuramate dehydrogenase